MAAFPKHLLHPRFWLVWVGVFIATVICFLPFRLRDRIAACAGRLSYRKKAKSVRYARTNLKICFPDWSEATREEFLKINLVRYFQVLAQSPYIWWGRRSTLKNKLVTENIENLTTELETQRPVILLFVHSMSIDLAAVALSTQFPMCGIYKPFNNAVIDFLFRRGRFRFGAHMSVRGNTLRTTLKAIKSGSLLVYLCDEDQGPEVSIFAPFFNHPKATLAALPRMVRHSDAKVVPVACQYDITSGKVITTFLPALADYPVADETENARMLNCVHEKLIEYCPEQYLWKLRYFRTRIDSSKSYYS